MIVKFIKNKLTYLAYKQAEKNSISSHKKRKNSKNLILQLYIQSMTCSKNTRQKITRTTSFNLKHIKNGK